MTDHGAVVVARAQGVHEPPGGAVEAAAQQVLGLAEHPVDAEVDVAARLLDHAVGVEQQRVAGGAAGRSTAVKSASSISPRIGPSLGSTLQRPVPAWRSAAGGWPAVRISKAPSTRSRERWIGGGEALLPVLAEQVVVGGREELLGGQRAEQAAERAGEQQRAGAGLLALAGHVDDGQLEPGRRRRRVATTKSPANGVPPAERSADSACQPVGQVGDAALLRIRSRRSTNIDSPSAPATPRRDRRSDATSTIRHISTRTPTAAKVRAVMSRPAG